AKLIVARALDADGVLVLNADDLQLRKHATAIGCRLAWFSLDDDHELLQAHRQSGGATCGVQADRLWLSRGRRRVDLGAITAMPLTAHGQARYNITNIAGSALLADTLGVDATTIADVLGHFGSQRSDNPGRLEQWQFGGIHA